MFYSAHETSFENSDLMVACLTPLLDCALAAGLELSGCDWVAALGVVGATSKAEDEEELLTAEVVVGWTAMA